MYDLIVTLICTVIIGYAVGKDQLITSEISTSRQGRCE